MSASRAPSFAATLIAATEGAVAISRAEWSMEWFDLVVGELV